MQILDVALSLPAFDKPVAFDSISRQELHELLVDYFVRLIQTLPIAPAKLIFRNEHTLTPDYEQNANLRYEISLLQSQITDFILSMPSVEAAETQTPGSTIPVYIRRTVEDCFNIAVKLCTES